MSKGTTRRGPRAPEPKSARKATVRPAAAKPEAPFSPAPLATSTRNEDQVPAASLDDPWANLHPARIWPD
jgi:hypothetical protein